MNLNWTLTKSKKRKKKTKMKRKQANKKVNPKNMYVICISPLEFVPIFIFFSCLFLFFSSVRLPPTDFVILTFVAEKDGFESISIVYLHTHHIYA